MYQNDLWKSRKVLITGHTGFKGSWLSLWLSQMGADILGYALPPKTSPDLFGILNLDMYMTSIYGDIRDRDKLKQTMEEFKPEIIFHLAAQPIVVTSYKDPLETLEINIMGTANLFNIVRNTDYVQVLVNVTSDKCYENKEQIWGYRENDPMGGLDPYSCSKGCSELITNSFRQSFFNDKEIMMASVRAGNVIGGGDWSENRLLPDIIRSLKDEKIIEIRNPQSIRPWQHVLEPLSGYILLAEKLWEKKRDFADGWNFGPEEKNVITVNEVVNKAVETWSANLHKTISYEVKEQKKIYETKILKLDSTKAKYKLDWSPRLDIDQTIGWTIDWYMNYYQKNEMRQFTLNQIKKYEDIR